jgi:hypothetical protein
MPTSGSRYVFLHRTSLQIADEFPQGPKVNIEHQMLGREGNIIDGKEDNGSEGTDSIRRKDSDDKKISEVA